MGWPGGHSWQTHGLYGQSSVEPDLKLRGRASQFRHLKLAEAKPNTLQAQVVLQRSEVQVCFYPYADGCLVLK